MNSKKIMNDILHITSGDSAGSLLAESGLPGEVFVWHDILYDGPRKPGWPDTETLEARADFLEETTGGGLKKDFILSTLKAQYQKLRDLKADTQIVLWFDACVFDQSMLAHVLCCLRPHNRQKVELLCINDFPGIERFNGLGQLLPAQLAGLYGQRQVLSEAQFQFAAIVDKAFATQDLNLLAELSHKLDAPLPWIPDAVRRWLQEQPDPKTGLGRLESFAMDAIHAGCETAGEIFSKVAAADRPPQYWGDITLWAKINALADHNPPLVQIKGPAARLPQWGGAEDLKAFRIRAYSN